MVPSPNVGTHDNFLIGVTTVLAHDVWTVGAYNNSHNIMNTLIEHWNGSHWSIVPSPNVGTHGSLIDTVAVISTNDIWTVGFYVNSQNLVEHWNGSQWSVVPTPNIASHDDFFQGLAADSANDLWAVGGDNDPVHHQQLTLIEHCC